MTLKLVTPHARLFDGPAAMFVAPGKLGEFGVLPGHDPWFVALGVGSLVVTKPSGETKEYFLNGGYCQIDDDNVVMLAEVAEPGDKIDVERAKAAKQRAEERLKNTAKDDSIDLMRAEFALRRALYRLEVAGRAK
jgi:F-type H+-transporting ATPase subunit epsilon